MSKRKLKIVLCGDLMIKRGGQILDKSNTFSDENVKKQTFFVDGRVIR